MDATSGRLLRTIPLGPTSYVGDPAYDNNFSFSRSRQPGVQSLAIDEIARRVFVLQASKSTTRTQSGVTPITGQVRILDAATGRISHTVPAGQNPLMLVADAPSGHLFVPDASPAISVYDHRRGSIRMLSAVTGALARTIPVDPDVYVSAVGIDVQREHILFQGAIQPRNDGIAVIDAKTGAVSRHFTLGGRSCTSIILDDRANHLIAGGGEARISNQALVFAASTGALLRLVTLPSDPNGAAESCPTPLAVDSAASRAFISIPPPYTVGSSYVSVLDTRSGQVVRTVNTGFGETTATAIAIDHQVGRTFVVDTVAQGPGLTVDINKLTVLDTRNGRVLQTMTLGQGPPVVAVDERTKRVFVVNGTDSTVSVLDASHA